MLSSFVTFGPKLTYILEIQLDEYDYDWLFLFIRRRFIFLIKYSLRFNFVCDQ